MGPIAPASHGLSRLREWMLAGGRTPYEFQEQTWAASLAGESGLVNVPTGAGKTYASYLGALAEMIDERESGDAEPGIRVLYLTPLRAVSRDVEKALRAPIDDLELPIRVESRTGDTSSSLRARQKKLLPEVLITTPESLSLLLTYPDAPERFAGLRCVIADEWHEMLGSKRGTQSELAIARLRSFAPELRVWALSATIGNLDLAAQAAVGVGNEPTLVTAQIDRPIELEAILPSEPGQLAWAGHLGLRMLSPVLDWLDPSRSTLIFCNTRSQAELWHQAIREARPAWEKQIALHHGSVDRDERERIEGGLKSGDLTLVVCTSSLDLGVDFAPVERVMQIGSPKGIARLIQRAGRSGHRPGETCRIACVPTHALELAEIAAARRAIELGEIEDRDFYEKPLDVLAQHLVTCALGGGFRPDELFNEVRRAHAYRDLTREEFDWALDLVKRGGDTLKAYPRYHKVVEHEGVCTVPDKRIAQIHRMNVGTITGEAVLSVRFVGGRTLGHIEENFISRMRKGQKFIFGGRLVRFERIKEMTAFVRPATGSTRHTPHWAGTKLPISESLGYSVRRTIEQVASGDASLPELSAVAPVIGAQARLSRVPKADQTLVEITDTREGRHLCVFPFAGRLVHAGIAAIVALRLGRLETATFTTAVNDYGFEVLCEDPFPFDEHLSSELFSTDRLLEDTLESVNVGQLARRQFREIARVAGLIVQQYPGSPRAPKQLQASAELIFEVFEQFDPGNMLMEQARREVLARQFQQTRLAGTMRRLAEQDRVVSVTHRPTPLGFPLMIERVAAEMSTESLADRVDKMRRQFLEIDAGEPAPNGGPARRRPPGHML
ncbi:MAG: ligase-associated DNA damage response DEXH box helicase [Planctomycetota bacterium]